LPKDGRLPTAGTVITNTQVGCAGNSRRESAVVNMHAICQSTPNNPFGRGSRRHPRMEINARNGGYLKSYLSTPYLTRTSAA
jgi:hypothetical protein